MPEIIPQPPLAQSFDAFYEYTLQTRDAWKQIALGNLTLAASRLMTDHPDDIIDFLYDNGRFQFRVQPGCFGDDGTHNLSRVLIPEFVAMVNKARRLGVKSRFRLTPGSLTPDYSANLPVPA